MALFFGRNHERLMAILRGKCLKVTAAELGMKPGALYQQLSAYARAQGVTTDQLKMQMAFSHLHLWQDATLDEQGLQEKWDRIRGEAKPAVDGALEGLGVSYILTLAPELRILYINRAGQALYRLDSAQDIFGQTLWSAMSAEPVWPLFNNLRSYHEQRVTMAKALMDMGSWMGVHEEARTALLLAPYRQFCDRQFPGLWNNALSDYNAVNANYRKEIKHWRTPSISMVFQASWSYRPEWGVYQVFYEPQGRVTISHMMLLRAR